jgi:nicotinamide phosphoribosyltransferase
MGGKDSEIRTFRRLIKDVYPSGIVSIVSDTWDFWKVITEFAAVLRQDILNRTPNGLGMAKVVFRPDSGDPVKIVAGLRVKDISEANFKQSEDGRVFVSVENSYKLEDEYDAVRIFGKVFEFGPSQHFGLILGREVPEHEVKGAVECLWDVFGGDMTEKGYKTLNQRVGLIYGDSITLRRAEEILQRLMDKGFSAGNIVFGVGSYTYQYITRDTFGMAVKATWGQVDGGARDIQKDPATGDGMKKSATGLLRVELEDGKFVLYDKQGEIEERRGELRTVFMDGEAVNTQTFAEIAARLKQ